MISGRKRKTKQRRINFIRRWKHFLQNILKEQKTPKKNNIILEMDEEERNEYLYKANYKYKKDDLNEMD